MDIKQATTDLEQFRTSLYQNFENRADTLMDLLDAMCSMPEAKSVVEYSLSSLFRRSYSTLFKGIAEIEFEGVRSRIHGHREKAWIGERAIEMNWRQRPDL